MIACGLLVQVAVLCRLNHPCVVRLLAVSLQPLCFVLELAPHGSLATVLDELSSKREAQEKQGSGVSRSRESILGRELSYKIAFQVISRLCTCRRIIMSSTYVLEDSPRRGGGLR